MSILDCGIRTSFFLQKIFVFKKDDKDDRCGVFVCEKEELKNQQI